MNEDCTKQVELLQDKRKCRCRVEMKIKNEIQTRLYTKR